MGFSCPGYNQSSVRWPVLLNTIFLLERLFNRSLIERTAQILKLEADFYTTSLSLKTVFYMAESGFKKDNIFVNNQGSNHSIIKKTYF